jgi:Phage minor capsid protein 2
MAVNTLPAVSARNNELSRIYETAEAELNAIITDALGRGANGTARYYANQRAGVRTILARMQDNSIPLVTHSVSEAYVTGARVAEKLGALDKGFAGVHQAAINTLADNMAGKLNEAAVTIGRNADDVFRKAALQEVAQGLAKGSARVDVSDSLIANLRKQGITAFVDKGGARWSLANYSKMVARTTTREAVSHGTANRMIENGQDLITISSHGTTCAICAEYDGNTYSLTGDTPGYEVLGEIPPFHPNCEHVLTPAAATFDAFEAAVNEVDATPPETAVEATPARASQ